MRQPIKLIVRKGKVRTDGTALISLQYCYSAEQRVVLSTGIGIPLQFWNRKTGRISKDLPVAYGNVQQLETGITEKLRKAEDMVTFTRLYVRPSLRLDSWHTVSLLFDVSRSLKHAAKRCQPSLILSFLKFATSEVSICLRNFFFSIHNKRTTSCNRFV